jgi:hypothetical protein
MSRLLKSDIVAEVADVLGVAPPKMSTGSTEPKELFILINDALGLGIPTRTTKPEMARAIVEASGERWGASCESRGGTVTAEGLVAVREAVKFFLNG